MNSTATALFSLAITYQHYTYLAVVLESPIGVGMDDVLPLQAPSSVWPDLVIYWTLGNFYRHLAIFFW